MGSGREMSMISKEVKACPYCSGQMEKLEDRWKCIQCSREWQSPHQRHKYLEDHKDDIIDLYNKEGTGAVRRVYSISQAGWFGIKKRWGLNKTKSITFNLDLSQLNQGGVNINLRIIDGTLIIENNEKVRERI